MRILAAIATLMLAITPAMNAASLYDIPLKDIDKKETSLKAYKGKVVLVVNVASKCGLTDRKSVV